MSWAVQDSSGILFLTEEKVYKESDLKELKGGHHS